MTIVPVLEIGGTHAGAALVDTGDWSVRAGDRVEIDGDADAEELIRGFAQAGAGIDAPRHAAWGVAMPDPFDYEAGIGLFEGVGKFGALHGFDVGAALARHLPGPVSVAFVNDADAFALGEWTSGAAGGVSRCVGLTLGTGVGSGWLVDGHVVDPGDPPGGRIHQTTADGAPLEDTMSRRAVRRAFASAGGDPLLDVREIADLAGAQDPTAVRVLSHAMDALGRTVGPRLRAFAADVLVVGGSMSRSWDLFAPWFAARAGDLPEIRVAAHPDTAPFVGAAVHAVRAAAPDRVVRSD